MSARLSEVRAVLRFVFWAKAVSSIETDLLKLAGTRVLKN